MSNEADKLVRQAESLRASAGKSGGFFSWASSSKEEKQDEVIDKYREAAALYRKAKELEKAGVCFERVASVFEEKGKDYVVSVVQALKDAAKVYHVDNLPKAISCLEKVILLYETKVEGGPRKAADVISSDSLGLASFLERSSLEAKTPEERRQWLDKAVAAWYKASEVYKTENTAPSLMKAQNNIGRLEVGRGNYRKAFEAFNVNVEICQKATDGKKLYLAAYQGNAGLCLLAENVEADSDARELIFSDWGVFAESSDISITREGRFLRAVFDAEKEGKKDEIDLAVKNIWLTKLDPWQKACVAQVKERITDEPDFS